MRMVRIGDNLMRKLKNSDIEWIGEIPTEWKTDRLQWHLKEIKVQNSPVRSEQVLSLTIETGVIPYEDKGNQGNKAKENYEEYKLAYPDTLVVNSMNVIIGAVGISKYFGCVSPVYYVFKATEDTDLRYIYYLFTNVGFQKEMRKYAKGILEIRLRISSADMLKRIIPKPSYEEQKRIADFLDRTCAEIDTVIEKTKATIEEYKKLKQSVITEAVTKGIRGDRAMKDSGIEWIGDIPAEWEITRVKNVATKLQKGNGITKEDIVANGDTPCVRYGEIYTKYNQSFTECVTRTNRDIIGAPKYFTCGDILFTCTGELVEEIGKSIVYLGSGECLAGGDIIIMSHKQNPAFLNYALNSAYAQAQKSCDKTKLKVVHISADDICNVVIALPSISEQEKIADYLDRKCAEIDKLIADKTHLLEEMESYKKSVIYEYVTGKKEVVL